jgi:LacI family transcriptional regulator
VILTPSVSEDERVVEVLRDIGCEYVRIASVLLDAPGHMIVSNDHLGGQAAARHLADLGHRKVAFISGPPSFRSSHERRRGFEAGLAERGLKLSARYALEGAYTFASGVECGRRLMDLKSRPTAIFAGNDEMAAGVLQAARMKGLSVPEDLSVVGFDDFQLASSVWPRLTTIHSPTRDIGRTAVRKLIGLAREDQAGAPEETSPTLVVRESSGPAPRG